MRAKLEKELKGLPPHFVVLAIVPSVHFEDANLHLLDIMMKTYNKKGSYITVNRPYKNMIEVLESKNINTQDLSFIDCITSELNEQDSTDHCNFIDSPSDLTGLGIALEPVFAKEDHRFIFLDSLDTLAVYNSMESVIKFAHFLTGKMRMHDFSGVMLTLHENSDKRLLSELSQFCDKVIDLR